MDIFDENTFIEIFDEDVVNVKRPNLDDKINKSEYLPWIEKYRPKKLDDIIQQDEVIKVLRNTLETGDLPHLLFYGPSGTGKTSTILAIAYQLFGSKKIGERVIELNASDDRGISIVRNTIIAFAKSAIGSKDPNYPCPSYKIVILDEADAMTPEAQAALRTIMETKSKITRFCFVCNYIHQIIDPISSRCMKFKFKQISPDAIVKNLKIISKNENIIINDIALQKIADISDGDLRKSIMTLQNLNYIANYKKNIFPRDITQLTGGVDEKNFGDLMKICLNGNICDIKNLAVKLHRDGYAVRNVVFYIHYQILNSSLSDEIKGKIALAICDIDSKLLEGSNEYLQLLHLLSFININTKTKN
jgi:replication factor C subunit 2/4